MAAKYLVVLACLALSRASVVKRDAPTILEDIQKHAQGFAKTWEESFKEFTNSKNTQDFQKTIKDGSDAVITQLSAFATSLQNAAVETSGKTKEALDASQASIKKSLEELRAAHPELEAQASSLKDKLTAAVQNTVQESQKLAKTLAENAEQANQKLGPQVKEAYEAFVKQAEAVQKKVHESANKQ